MLDLSKGTLFFAGLALIFIWSFVVLPVWYGPPAMTWQEIGAIAAAASAFFAALSSGASWFSTMNVRRQFTNASLDACLGAAIALKGAVYKIMAHKIEALGAVDPVQVWAAYDDAWTKWLALNQTFRVAQRYAPSLNFDAPDQLSGLLSELRLGLYAQQWPGDAADIRPRVDAVVRQIYLAVGLPPEN